MQDRENGESGFRRRCFRSDTVLAVGQCHTGVGVAYPHLAENITQHATSGGNSRGQAGLRMRRCHTRRGRKASWADARPVRIPELAYDVELGRGKNRRFLCSPSKAADVSPLSKNRARSGKRGNSSTGTGSRMRFCVLAQQPASASLRTVRTPRPAADAGARTRAWRPWQRGRAHVPRLGLSPLPRRILRGAVGPHLIAAAAGARGLDTAEGGAAQHTHSCCQPFRVTRWFRF